MTVGEFIRSRRLLLGMSAKEVARKAGVTDVYILYIEKGMRNPTFKNLMKIISALGVPFDEFLRETGYSDSNVEPAFSSGARKIPIVSWVVAGRWKEVCDAFEPGDADEWVESEVKGKNVFALRVVGDSMEPEFKEGEILTVNPHVDVSPGDFVVVRNKSGEATFKQLKKYGPRWVLHPLNPKYQDIEVKRGDFRVIGKVVKKERRY